MDSRLNAPWVALRLGIGLMAALAGLDKFVNLLADWSHYVSPLAAQALPFSVPTFMAIVGVIEFAVGVAILAGWTRLGAYVASAWLLGVAANLVAAGFFDVAVRDVVLALAAFTLARLAEVQQGAPVRAFDDVLKQTGRTLTAVALVAAAALPVSASALTESDLKQDMRRLWSDHVMWTRSYIVATLSDDPSASAAAERLMRNQEDIGKAIVPFYGEAAGQQLTKLLKEHITIAVDVVSAAKRGDKAAHARADAAWQANGVAIAEFLSKANPNWPKATLVSMMKEHLSTTTTEVVARLNKDWKGDAAAFDAVYAHILHMADALAAGIVKQFPAKFAAVAGSSTAVR